MAEWFVSSAVLAALLIGAHYLLRGTAAAVPSALRGADGLSAVRVHHARFRARLVAELSRSGHNSIRQPDRAAGRGICEDHAGFV